ncbi:hypothetical protein M011DRAFT_524965 [Sporormia fimetaria CBS 119925]|uniref:GET complex, subunit GET2 n=1 Tax=Sporormia fimetaria CBS 119925 TaxID=1340428 RepID=A0A6A6VFJ3_9PLEO|nr:hypothetical protein M011DRAFT_524965 [Sporormia fimetaria CBS 119925]
MEVPFWGFGLAIKSVTEWSQGQSSQIIGCLWVPMGTIRSTSSGKPCDVGTKRSWFAEEGRERRPTVPLGCSATTDAQLLGCIPEKALPRRRGAFNDWLGKLMLVAWVRHTSGTPRGRLSEPHQGTAKYPHQEKVREKKKLGLCPGVACVTVEQMRREGMAYKVRVRCIRAKAERHCVAEVHDIASNFCLRTNKLHVDFWSSPPYSPGLSVPQAAMADYSPSTSADATESPAQQKARLRRERMAAKLQSGGASRLQAISALQGGTYRDVDKDVPAKPSPSVTASEPAGTATPDPEEIDISAHHYTPASQPRLPSPFAYNAPPFSEAGPTPDPSQDPMMAMLQQMMGPGAGSIPGLSGFPGQPSQPGQAGQPDDLMAGLLNAMQGGAARQPPPDQSFAWLWRLIHAVFSLGLAIYMVLQTPFTGSKLSRSNSESEADWTLDTPTNETFRHFFVLFATFELVMQSSRYFLEKGQAQGSGMLSLIARYLPEPYGRYARLVGRYSVIFSTVASDALVVVFVLGAASWWNGNIATA